MLNFILNTAKLWALSMALCILIVFLPKLTPRPDTMSIFKLQQCKLPCWIGILPGSTTIGEARKLIQSNYPEFHVEVLNVTKEFSLAYHLELVAKDGHYLSVVLNEYANEEQSDASIIYEIALYTGNTRGEVAAKPTVVDMMLALGRPACLDVLWGNHTAWPAMLYPDFQTRITAGLPDFRIDPNISSGLHIFDNTERCRTKWRGFGYNHYRDLIASMLP